MDDTQQTIIMLYKDAIEGIRSVVKSNSSFVFKENKISKIIKELNISIASIEYKNEN
jgi:hypothetical protein